MGEPAEERMVTVPDFKGMNRQQAADAAGKLGLYILVSGNQKIEPGVTAVAQSVPAGNLVTVGTTVQVEFIDTRAAD